MQGARRRREVSSCVPCYTRKQKCDRQYPCKRCSRRRQPELCTYYNPQHHAPGANPPGEASRDEEKQVGPSTHWEQNVDDGDVLDVSPPLLTPGPLGRRGPSPLSLAEAFGYYGQSEFNTMTLVRKLVQEDDGPDARDVPLSEDTINEVRKALDKLVSRPIIDFLVRYLVTKINWIDQILYTPWFLDQYQKWWNKDRPSTAADIEFFILFLRISYYASQFLPSPVYTIDTIRGVSLSDIRQSCDDAILALVPICVRLDPRGSLVRVQHISFAGLSAICLGRMNAFWESLSCATRVAQQIGLHLSPETWDGSIDELEKEMRRRTYCNLYIWDSCLSKRLDRIPFLPDNLRTDIMPRMRLSEVDVDARADVPDVFTERVLRAQLAHFWRSHGPSKTSENELVAAQERYESFCTTFLQTIPPTFSLHHPDKRWDERLVNLPLQRQLLHIAIFEFLCWNFRSGLLQKSDPAKTLPGYKQILKAHNNVALAAAALSLLEGVSTLHNMMGGSHTRFAGIIVPTFEAAVPLLCLCAEKGFPTSIAEVQSNTTKTDLVGLALGNVTRDRCMQAARDALACLRNLSEVSKMAEVGARTLARLVSKVNSVLAVEDRAAFGEMNGDSGIMIPTPGSWHCDTMQECAATRAVPGELTFGLNDCSEAGPNWEEALRDLSGTFGLDEISFLGPVHL